jgi:hypothetical protein
MKLILAYNKEDTSALADSIADRYGFKEKLNVQSLDGHLYKGKFGGINAVLKLEHRSSKTNEAAKAKIVQKVRETAGELADFLPKIWLISETEDKEFSVIIMEQLQPLPSKIKRELFAAIEKREKADPYAPLKVFQNLALLRKTASRYLPTQIEQTVIESTAIAIASSAEGMSEFSAVDLINRAARKLKTFVERVPSLNKTVKQAGIKPADLHMVIQDTIKSILRMSLIPSQKGADFVEAEPGTKYSKAIQALDLLSHSGLHWDDLHDENLLYRKSTDTPVFIDFGQYNMT